MYIVYLLRCADMSLYTGISNNLEQRLKMHRDGQGSKYVRTRLPVELVYSEEQPTKSLALQREFALKQLSKAQKEALLEAYSTS